MKPKSVYHDPTHLRILTPYDPRFVEAIKREIPSHARSWDPATKTWHVRAPYDDIANHILLTFFPGATVGRKPTETTSFNRQGTCGCDADHRTLLVCQDAPPELVKAAYRVLAKQLHPDAGGDVATMQKLNAAYERLESVVRS